MNDLTYEKAIATLDDLRNAINKAADVVDRAKQGSGITPNGDSKPPQ